MYSYITDELPVLIEQLFPVGNKRSITGHSMGGHGALVCGLKSKKYVSISAFAPICNPTKAPWGIKAFGSYLNGDGSEYDAVNIL